MGPRRKPLQLYFLLLFVPAVAAAAVVMLAAARMLMMIAAAAAAALELRAAVRPTAAPSLRVASEKSAKA